MRSLVALLVRLVPVTLLGCGSAGPEFAEVSGTVRLNGKPLANVRVEFLPDPEKGMKDVPSSSGVTDKNGHYRLVSGKQRDGAVVGHHRVLVHDLNIWEGSPPDRTPENFKPKPSRIASKYSDVAATPLKKEVKSQPQTIDLEVTAR